LIPQIVDAVRIPVLAAGSIVDGRGLAAALSLGAQGVWIGTRFIASDEARASRVYKQRIIDSEGTDTVVTRCYSGKPMRVIRNAYVEDWERRGAEIQPFPRQLVTSAQAGVMSFMRDDATDPARTCMPAGQGIGGIDEILPAKVIVERILAEAADTIGRLDALRRGA
jgi:enoyl-[acyl-carrier protein] reductase II